MISPSVTTYQPCDLLQFRSFSPSAAEYAICSYLIAVILKNPMKLLLWTLVAEEWNIFSTQERLAQGFTCGVCPTPRASLAMDMMFSYCEHQATGSCSLYLVGILLHILQWMGTVPKPPPPRMLKYQSYWVGGIPSLPVCQCVIIPMDVMASVIRISLMGTLNTGNGTNKKLLRPIILFITGQCFTAVVWKCSGCLYLIPIARY